MGDRSLVLELFGMAIFNYYLLASLLQIIATMTAIYLTVSGFNKGGILSNLNTLVIGNW